MSPLIDCPFCGKPAYLNDIGIGVYPVVWLVFAECSSCSSRGSRCKTREEAIAAWNKVAVIVANRRPPKKKAGS
jgi:hypothetical protein